jgi:tetratricopeptide (TPR) repeat protein
MDEIVCPKCGKPTERVANLAVCWSCKKGYVVSGGGTISGGEHAATKDEVPIEYIDLLNRHEKLLSSDPENIHLLFGKALILTKMKRYDEALVIFDKVISKDPVYKKVWVAKAETLAAMGKFEEAAKHYRKALIAAEGRDPTK